MTITEIKNELYALNKMFWNWADNHKEAVDNDSREWCARHIVDRQIFLRKMLVAYGIFMHVEKRSIYFNGKTSNGKRYLNMKLLDMAG